MVYLTVNDSISILPFSVRLYNGLNRAGINTVGDILEYSRKHLWADIHALGEKSINEITEWLQRLEEGSGDFRLVSDEERERYLFKATTAELLQYIPVRDVHLSVSARNGLLESGKFNLAQAAALSEEELLILKRMGKKAAKEILEFCSELHDMQRISELFTAYTAIDPHVVESSDAYLASKERSDKLSRWEDYIRELVNSWGGTKDTYVQALTEIFDKHPDAQGETITYLLYDEPLIRNRAKAIILQVIEKRMEGVSRERMERSIPDHLKNTTILDEILIDLENEGKIISDDDILHYIYPSFFKSFSISVSEKDQKAIEYLKMRLEGKTLAEIGEMKGMTRERIRQVTANYLKKMQLYQENGQLPSYFAEDRYRYIFEHYRITREEFLFAFDNESPMTYNYLTLVSETKAESKCDLYQALQDESISVEMRRLLERAVYKDYVYLDGVRIKKERALLVQHYIRNNCIEVTAFDDFVSEYHQWLERNELLDERIMINDGASFENRLQVSEYVLWNQGRKFRYYPISGRDFSDVIGCIDTEQYANTEISTLKLFRDFPEIMQEFDIRNEYELHNLLRKILPETCTKIRIHRMPTIEIGEANRDDQILSLLLQYAPISAEELAKKYEETYGARATTVQAGYFRDYGDYLFNGVYSIDADNLPQGQFERMKELLDRDYYAIADIKRIYHREFPDENQEQINPYTLKTLGFNVFSGYVVRKTFASASDYFHQILTEKPIIDGRTLDARYYDYSAFTGELAALKQSWEIVEFAPKQYINISRLNENGITVEQLKDYEIAVRRFVPLGSFFTINSIRKEGFVHQLDDLGFEEWFYASVLLEDREHFSYQRIGGTRLFCAGKSLNLFADFMNWLLNQLGKIDIYDLCELLETQYGIILPRDKVIELIRNTDLYYDTIMKTVYVDYDTYFEEV